MTRLAGTGTKPLQSPEPPALPPSDAVPIERLTAGQDARRCLFALEYLRYSLSTAPADRPRAEAAFARAYAKIGREPVPVVWVDNPADAARAIAASWTAESAGIEDRHAERIQTCLRSDLWDCLNPAVEASVGAALRECLSETIKAPLGSHAGLLWRNLFRSLEDALEYPANGKLYTCWTGMQELDSVAEYLFCAKIGVNFGPDASDKLDIMHEIGRSCFWWYPCSGVVYACERPAEIHLDEAGRMHREHGPALLLRDGYGVHAVRGVVVPAGLATSGS